MENRNVSLFNRVKDFVPSDEQKVERRSLLDTGDLYGTARTNVPVEDKPFENIDEKEEKNCNTQSQDNYEELVKLFGSGFSKKGYEEMYQKYISLQSNYPLRTEMHKESLITYVKYAYKRDQAIANDDMDAADKWGKLCAKQATDAKINPSQLSAADLSDGISNFSKLVETVEKARDIIPILPKWLQEPQDGLDYYMWQEVQYLRRLENKPLIKYSDIYAFMGEQYQANKDKYDFIAREVDGNFDAEESDF